MSALKAVLKLCFLYPQKYRQTVSFDSHSLKIFYFSNNNKNSAFQDSYNQTHSFVTDSVKLVVDVNQVSGWPGQRLYLSLRALDEFGNPSGSLTRFYFNRHNNNYFVSISSKYVSKLCLDMWT